MTIRLERGETNLPAAWSDTINSLLDRCSGPDGRFPPTILYNEGWMLRLLLAWFEANRDDQASPFSIPSGCKWYSEALLPSAFLPRTRGDKFSEGWTHADGAIGEIAIGKERDGDLTLLPEAKTFKVIEAKMFSKLSRGTTHARYYNQAARNVACMAEVLFQARKKPQSMSSLAFYVVAPKSQIEVGLFEKQMSLTSVHDIVERRLREYDKPGPREIWFQDWFLPLMEVIDLRVLSWEEQLDQVAAQEAKSRPALSEFYKECLRYDRLRAAQRNRRPSETN
jgi:hypothetical protein